MKEEEESTSSLQNSAQFSDFTLSNISITSNEKNSLSKIDKLLDDIKPTLTKIRCPYCPLNCVCQIDPKNYTISSDCSKNHHFISDLKDFYNNSLLQQDENIKCGNDNCKCNKNEKLELYYCNCGEILCKKCIDNHVNMYKNDKNVIHNCVKFIKKDEICCCDGHFAKFSCYCQQCQKNLCTNCYNSHKKNKHIIYFYGDEKINKTERKRINNELQQQKIDLNKFIEKTNQIMEGLKKRINELITNLKYFVKINGIIFKLDNNKKLNHEIITNIKNLKTQFDEKISTFLNEPDFNNSVFFLLNSFDYKKIDKEKKKYVVEKDNKSKVYNFYINTVKDYPLEEKINVMCELKSKNLLAFGGESGKIYLYNNKNFGKVEFDITNEKQSIKYLYELKDGFLVVCTSDYFKIYEIKIENNLKEFHVIQKIDYLEKNFEDSKFKVAELRNGKLLSADGSLVKIWRKKLNNNLYDLEHEIKMNDLIFDLFEMNINMFAVYTINNNINVFDSENYEKKYNNQLSIKNNSNWKIVSVQKLNDHTIIIVEKNEVLLYSILENKITKCDSPKNIDGLYMICSNHFYIYNTEIENRNYNVIKYEYSTSKKNICKQNKISYEHQIGFMNIISLIYRLMWRFTIDWRRLLKSL